MDQNSNEKERILRLAAGLLREPDQEEEEGGIDYAGEYRKQTGKDFVSGEYVVQ